MSLKAVVVVELSGVVEHAGIWALRRTVSPVTLPLIQTCFISTKPELVNLTQPPRCWMKPDHRSVNEHTGPQWIDRELGWARLWVGGGMIVCVRMKVGVSSPYV